MAGTPMQGMHSLWYDHYKGAVYPLDLDAQPNCRQKRTEVPTLLEACCSYIVRDASLTRQTITDVPSILCINLMEAALRGNHDRSVQALMSQWKLPYLVLSKLVPSVFSSHLPLYDTTYQSDLVRQGLRYTTSLAHTFLECLRQESPTKIRKLDLTGFPTAEVILYYLTSHCMLVHNENRRNDMVHLYNQVVNAADDLGTQTNSHELLEMQNSLPLDISVDIKLDAFVTSESCHSELCKALTVSSFPGSRFTITVERLSVTCLGGDRVNLLLNQLKSETLKGLQLKYNSLRNTDFIRLAPILQSLTKLTALDLSCNHINLFNDAPMAAILRQSLSTLSQLHRLDLSNSRLKNKLSVVLGGLSGRLKHLRLAACGLTQLDISGLVRIVKTEKHPLEELDLSENKIGLGWDDGSGLGNPNTSSGYSLLQLVGDLHAHIRLLELQDCGLDVELMQSGLTPLLCRCPNLLMVNLQANHWPTACTLDLVGRLLAAPIGLHVLQLSYSLDCYPQYGQFEEDEQDDYLQRRGDLQDQFNQSLSKVTHESLNQNVKLLLTDMEHSIRF